MKIKPEHYSKLKAAIAQYEDLVYPHIEEVKKKGGFSNLKRRIAWDLYHAAVVWGLDLDLYSYLDDRHIETALFSILKELDIKID